jgi:hypothetical protein
LPICDLHRGGRLRSPLLHYLWAYTTKPLSEAVTLQFEYPRRLSLRRMKNEAIGWTPGRISGKWVPGSERMARQVALMEQCT